MISVPTHTRVVMQLLGNAIDYAGLFPPAQLEMTAAVNNYASYRLGQHSGLLGRFILPLTRLPEFEKALAQLDDEDGWRISVLGGANPAADVAAIFNFNKRHSAMIDTVELKATTVDDIKAIGGMVPSVLTTFVEIPIREDPTELLASIHSFDLRAKVRTGGITADAFPSSTQLTKFLLACIKTRTPFKATAGLHHPMLGNYRLTYEPGSALCSMFGFLNLFAASGVALLGGAFGKVKAALEESDPAMFEVNDEEIVWRGVHLSSSSTSLLRTTALTSFGSCSFTEPIEELKSLRLL